MMVNCILFVPVLMLICLDDSQKISTIRNWQRGVKHFKEEKGGRKIMSEAVEKYAEKYAERKVEITTENKQLEILKNIMESLKMTAEQAMAAMQLSEQDKTAMLKRL